MAVDISWRSRTGSHAIAKLTSSHDRLSTTKKCWSPTTRHVFTPDGQSARCWGKSQRQRIECGVPGLDHAAQCSSLLLQLRQNARPPHLAYLGEGDRCYRCSARCATGDQVSCLESLCSEKAEANWYSVCDISRWFLTGMGEEAGLRSSPVWVWWIRSCNHLNNGKGRLVDATSKANRISELSELTLKQDPPF